ncbi:hypothetical protein NOVO_01695 [Rickettsiales bacterium Ac37b]|nr:hypothetical protein NOVO_01695 [Rickettsiales bacterium Ac37b]
MNDFLKNINYAYFFEEPFTRREAWSWLVENAIHGELSYSIRSMASIWKWHRSKVERFLTSLKNESLIKTEVKSGQLLIMIGNCKQFKPDASQIEIVEETKSETVPSQKQDNLTSINQLQDGSSDTETQYLQGLAENLETDSSQFQDENCEKEEKKKRSKKRKEENNISKEKNTPYRGIKKEKFLSSFSRKSLPFDLVEIADVEHWGEKTLPIDVDLAWELGKFKDYWLSTRKKPPKDGIAAFRNWLRKSVELKTQGKTNENNYYTERKEHSGIDNFFLGAAELAAKLERH